MQTAHPRARTGPARKTDQVLQFKTDMHFRNAPLKAGRHSEIDFRNLGGCGAKAFEKPVCAQSRTREQAKRRVQGAPAQRSYSLGRETPRNAALSEVSVSDARTFPCAMCRTTRHMLAKGNVHRHQLLWFGEPQFL